MNLSLIILPPCTRLGCQFDLTMVKNNIRDEVLVGSRPASMGRRKLQAQHKSGLAC